MTRCECGAEPSNKDLGIEVPGIYDGTLIWQCDACKRYRPRALEGRLYRVALEIIERWEKP